MRFDEKFVVGASREETWTALADMERVYGCLPGAQVAEVAEDRCRGTLRMKIGPISTTYEGEAHFESRDENSGHLIILAKGTDQRGRGTASARVTAQLTELAPTQTQVEMENDVAITGRLAQFGRGVISDVSREMIGEFASNLEAVIRDGEASRPEAKGQTTTANDGQSDSNPGPAPPEDPPVMDMGAVALRIARRRAPHLILAGVIFLVLILALLRLVGAI